MDKLWKSGKLTIFLLACGSLVSFAAQPSKKMIPIYKCVRDDGNVFTDLPTQLIGCKEVMDLTEDKTIRPLPKASSQKPKS